VVLVLAGLAACGSAVERSGTVTSVTSDDGGATPAPLETTTPSTMASTPARPGTPIDPGLSLVAEARADLAARLDVQLDSITVVDARSVTWGDRSYGCPEPGMRYLPGVIEGVLVVLETGGRRYEYHGGEGTAPFLCEPGRGPVR
jgi:hypothetical protein